MCRETQMGVAAAQLALADGRVELGSFQPERAGVIYGSDYMLSPPDEFRASGEENGNTRPARRYQSLGQRGTS